MRASASCSGLPPATSSSGGEKARSARWGHGPMAKLMKDAGHDGATGHTVTHSALQQAQRRRETRPSSAGRAQEDVFTRLYKNSQFGARNHHRNKRQDMLRLLKVNDNPLELDASGRAVFEQLRELPTEGFEGFEAEFEGTEVPTPDATLGRTAPPTLGRVASAPQLSASHATAAARRRQPAARIAKGGEPARRRAAGGTPACRRRRAPRGVRLRAVQPRRPPPRRGRARIRRSRPGRLRRQRRWMPRRGGGRGPRQRRQASCLRQRRCIQRTSARPASAGGARVVEGVSIRHTMRTTPARHSIVHHCCCAGVGCTSPQPDAASYEAGRRSIEQRVPPRRPVSAGPRASGAAAARGASVTAEDLFRGVGARVAVGGAATRRGGARRGESRRRPSQTRPRGAHGGGAQGDDGVGADAPAVLLRVMSRLQPPVQEADESAATGPAPSASRPDLA